LGREVGAVLPMADELRGPDRVRRAVAAEDADAQVPHSRARTTAW
jgi:hypothetical protein